MKFVQLVNLLEFEFSLDLALAFSLKVFIGLLLGLFLYLMFNFFIHLLGLIWWEETGRVSWGRWFGLFIEIITAVIIRIFPFAFLKQSLLFLGIFFLNQLTLFQILFLVKLRQQFFALWALFTQNAINWLGKHKKNLTFWSARCIYAVWSTQGTGFWLMF